MHCSHIFRAAVLAEINITLADLQRELNATVTQLKSISEPDVFSCKRMSGFSDETIPIPYTACDVEKPIGLVDISTGKFTVQRDGTYRLTFTSRYSRIFDNGVNHDYFQNVSYEWSNYPSRHVCQWSEDRTCLGKS